MFYFIVIAIGLVFFIILWNRDTYTTNHSHQTTTNLNSYNLTVNQEANTIISAAPSRISVTPTTIKSNPDLRLSLVDGEYRYFQNHFVNGKQYAFGFPHESCKDKRVWVGINKREVERISESEAFERINNKSYLANQIKSIDSASYKIGYCTRCDKKLRRNIYKKVCTECYHKGYS